MTALNFTRRILPALGALALLAAPALARAQAVPAAPPTVGVTANAPAPVLAAPKSKTMMSGKLPMSDEFKTTALATAHCPGDKVVWSTLSKSKSYHLASSKYYGKTKHGAYVCEKDATAAGFHASSK